MPPALDRMWESMSRMTPRSVAAAPVAGVMTRASPEQVHQVAGWLAHRYFADAFAVLPEEARGGHPDAAAMFKRDRHEDSRDMPCTNWFQWMMVRYSCSNPSTETVPVESIRSAPWCGASPSHVAPSTLR